MKLVLMLVAIYSLILHQSLKVDRTISFSAGMAKRSLNTPIHPKSLQKEKKIKNDHDEMIIVNTRKEKQELPPAPYYYHPGELQSSKGISEKSHSPFFYNVIIAPIGASSGSIKEAQ